MTASWTGEEGKFADARANRRGKGDFPMPEKRGRKCFEPLYCILTRKKNALLRCEISGEKKRRFRAF